MSKTLMMILRLVVSAPATAFIPMDEPLCMQNLKDILVQVQRIVL